MAQITRTRSPRPDVRGKRPAAIFLNRELSWLAFNHRVLEQVRSERHPLLERVRFLSIVSSNLDEFFEIRVAGLMQQMDSGVTEAGADGLAPEAQLDGIHERVTALVAEQYRCWHELLLPALADEGIEFRTAKYLNPAELKWVQSYFRNQVYPVLTPLALDQSHPFPQLGNKTLNIIVSLDNPTTPEVEQHVAILPVPRILPRLVEIPPAKTGGPRHTIFLSEIIKICAGQLFPGYRLNAAHAFRVTRNSDLYIDEEESENLLKKIEDELRNLRRGAAVRLEVEDGVHPDLFELLCENLSVSKNYVYRINGPVNLLRLQALADVERPDLKFAPFTPVNTTPLAEPARIFDTLRVQDVLLHHPYDSFQPVVDFVEQAARDPQVFAIKQTFYRTSGDSPLVRALIEASHNGKQVTALVDRATIESLYAASQAGVKIDLIVRGVCCLVPGIKGLSENIRVRSIVGRFLEHARAMYFENAGGEPLILAGSADWMPRNFFRRIEVVFPIEDPALRRWMMRDFFAPELRDNANAHALRADGTYQPVKRRAGQPSFSVQDHLMAAANRRATA